MDTLEVIVHANGVREVRLIRPDIADRFDAALHVDLTRTLQELSSDDDIRVIVLTSTGKVFSAGGDFELMEAALADATVRRSIVDEARDLIHALIECPHPIIAAVHGPAIGLGATVALACDAVVAARTAYLADTHVALGLVAGDGGVVFWPAAAGMMRARRYLLTGDRVDAEAAHAFGLVTDLVDTAADTAPAAFAIAQRIAAHAPLAIRGTKRALNAVTRHRSDEVLDIALEEEERTLGSPDLREGIAAFRERRSPRFTGERP